MDVESAWAGNSAKNVGSAKLSKAKCSFTEGRQVKKLKQKQTEAAGWEGSEMHGMDPMWPSGCDGKVRRRGLSRLTAESVFRRW